MPVSFPFTYIPPPPSSGSVPSATVSLPTLPNPFIAYALQDFLDLYERLFPDHWLAPLKNPGPGYEVLQAFAQLGVALSNAVVTLAGDSLFTVATGGGFAAGEVQLFRASPLQNGIPVQNSDGSIQAGVTASIVTGAGGGNVRVTGLSRMTPGAVGQSLQISNTGFAPNSGTFHIVAWVDPQTVDVANGSASAPDANNGAITWAQVTFTVVVKAGTVVTTSKTGRDFATQADVTFQQTDLGPFTVAVQALAQDYLWNVPGTLVSAGGEALPGEIDTMKFLMEDPLLGDTSIQVSQAAATSGGFDPALDQLGLDRGLFRYSGEVDSKYRARVSTLPDTISPDAFERSVSALLNPVHAGFELIETWDIAYQTCYDAPNAAIPGSNFNPNLFTYDDPRPATPFINRWLDVNDFRGGVIVVADNIQPLNDFGMVYDDPAEDYSSLISPVTGGTRSASAYDVPPSADITGVLTPTPRPAGFTYLPPCYDGLDVSKNALYNALYVALQNTKAGGVIAALELAGQ